MKRHIIHFLKHYAWLADNTVRRGGGCFWQVLPKHHYFFHVALQCDEINPRSNQTYLDESFVGRICNIYKKSLDGPFAATVQSTILQKWLMGLMADMGIHG